jgi:hypothetical protein
MQYYLEINRGITLIDRLKPADRGSSGTFAGRSWRRTSATEAVDLTKCITTVRKVNNIIAVIATNIVNNAITDVTINIVTITKLANIVCVIANVFASFYFLFPPRT